MRRTAGAAKPASAALIRRRRDGDPPTLRDSFIHLLLGKASPLRAMLGTWRSCDNPGLAAMRERAAAALVARRRLCERSDCPGAPGGWSVANAPPFPGVLCR